MKNWTVEDTKETLKKDHFPEYLKHTFTNAAY